MGIVGYNYPTIWDGCVWKWGIPTEKKLSFEYENCQTNPFDGLMDIGSWWFDLNMKHNILIFSTWSKCWGLNGISPRRREIAYNEMIYSHRTNIARTNHRRWRYTDWMKWTDKDEDYECFWMTMSDCEWFWVNLNNPEWFWTTMNDCDSWVIMFEYEWLWMNDYCMNDYQWLWMIMNDCEWLWMILWSGYVHGIDFLRMAMFYGNGKC